VLRFLSRHNVSMAVARARAQAGSFVGREEEHSGLDETLVLRGALSRELECPC
jgi:anti-sigma factor ChrR (cupin superfamily)